MLSTSLAIATLIATLIDRFAVHGVQRWAYTDQMPSIFALDVGLIPPLQMPILPPLIFLLLTSF